MNGKPLFSLEVEPGAEGEGAAGRGAVGPWIRQVEIGRQAIEAGEGAIGVIALVEQILDLAEQLDVGSQAVAASEIHRGIAGELRLLVGSSPTRYWPLCQRRSVPMLQARATSQSAERVMR